MWLHLMGAAKALGGGLALKTGTPISLVGFDLCTAPWRQGGKRLALALVSHWLFY